MCWKKYICLRGRWLPTFKPMLFSRMFFFFFFLTHSATIRYISVLHHNPVMLLHGEQRPPSQQLDFTPTKPDLSVRSGSTLISLFSMQPLSLCIPKWWLMYRKSFDWRSTVAQPPRRAQSLKSQQIAQHLRVLHNTDPDKAWTWPSFSTSIKSCSIPRFMSCYLIWCFMLKTTCDFIHMHLSVHPMDCFLWLIMNILWSLVESFSSFLMQMVTWTSVL